MVRLYLPRRIGPGRFGAYSLAESLAQTATGLTTLGIDDYTRKEIPLRPRHASDYFGGIAFLRLLLGLLLLGGLVLSLSGTSETARVTFVFGLGFIAQVFTQSQAALLMSHGTVALLAVTNVLVKLLWGGLLILGLHLGAGLEVLAGAFLIGELVRALILHVEARRQMGLELRLDLRKTWGVLMISTPYIANGLASGLNRLDVPVLAYMGKDDRVVGWYGAAFSFSLLVYLFLPLFNSVLMPLMARVRARSEPDLWRVVNRCAEGLLAAAIPGALLVALGADLWVRLAFGEAFAPAAASLRVFAMQAALTYLTSLYAIVLVIVERAWTVTISSLVSIIAKPAFVALLIPPCARLFGVGGAGAGAALGIVATEVLVLAMMLRVLGRVALGARVMRLIVRGAVLSIAVVVLHFVLAPLGAWRLAVDMLAYVAAAIPLGALPVREMTAFIHEAVIARRDAAPAAEA